MEVKMKKIFLFCVFLSILFFVAGCGGSKKETINDSDAVPDDDIETADPENDPAEDDTLPDEEEKSDEEDMEPPDEQISVTQECFGKKVLVRETVSVEEYDYRGNSYEYYIDRYYDENCRIKFETKYRVTDSILKEQKSRSYEYDDKGNVTRICKRNMTGNLTGECQRFSYEFNDDGTVRKMCVGKSAEGREAGCIRYLYDKNGRIKQKIRRSAVKETFPFFRDFSDEDAEYLSEDYAVAESVKIKGETLSEELDMQERVDYFYDEKGKLTEKKRYFISREFGENGKDAAVYYYGDFIPYYMTSIDMTAKKRITYDYSDGLLLKSHHDLYEYYMACSNAAWSWHKREYEKEYFYDEKMHLVRITTSPDERNLVSIDEEREYYPDGSLKREVTTFDDDGARSTCDWDYHNPKAEERIYDEKGRETGYNKIGYSGEVYVTTTRTYYDNSSEVKQETICNNKEECTSYSYAYEHDGLGRVTEERKEYDDPVKVYIDIYEGVWKKQVDVTYYKYTETGKLKESRAYTIQRDYEDETAPETVSKKRIEIYIYDDKDRLIEIRSASSWNEENPDIGSMAIQTEYDSLGRVVADNNHVYEYRGDTGTKYKTWNKWGSTVYKYDENGNLVSEKYDKGAQRYNMDFEYDEDGYPVSAVKNSSNDERDRKESRTYSYETFRLP